MTDIRSSGRDRPLHFMQGSRGFSLIELLIVIAIIAVLVILGFSSVSSMRESANLAKCMGNLRSWGSIIHAYAADHQGELPMNETPKNFYYDLAPYGQYDYPYMPPDRFKRTILFCPSEKVFGQYSYAMNLELNYRIYGEKARVRVQSLTNISTYVLMSDSYTTSALYTHTRQKFQDYSQATRRHKGFPNFLYADGHVSQFKDRMIGWGEIAQAGTDGDRYLKIWFANGIRPEHR